MTPRRPVRIIRTRAMSKLASEVARAVEAQPCSLRKLAAAAGVSDTLLRKIVQGDRTATPATARAVAEALERWARNASASARRLRAATGPSRRGAK